MPQEAAIMELDVYALGAADSHEPLHALFPLNVPKQVVHYFLMVKD